MKRLCIHGQDSKPQFKQVPLDQLPPGYVRVQTRAIAVNPVDLEVLKAKYAVGCGMGCDFAGVVIEVGLDVARVVLGDTVAGGVAGDDVDCPDAGAFSDSVVVPADSLFVLKLWPAKTRELPFGHVNTFEQAASLAHGVCTAALSAVWYNKMELKPKRRLGFSLIYGASSTLGFYAAQLYHYLGYKVIIVASKAHWKMFDAIGIFLRVDYHNDDWVQRVQAIGKDSIVHAYDCIARDRSFERVVQCCSKTQPVIINSALPISFEHFPNLGPNVQFNTPIYFLLWRLAWSWGGWNSHGDEQLLKSRGAIFEALGEFLDRVVALPITVVGDGFDAISAALQTLEGGVSAHKIVVRM